MIPRSPDLLTRKLPMTCMSSALIRKLMSSIVLTMFDVLLVLARIRGVTLAEEQRLPRDQHRAGHPVDECTVEPVDVGVELAVQVGFVVGALVSAFFNWSTSFQPHAHPVRRAGRRSRQFAAGRGALGRPGHRLAVPHRGVPGRRVSAGAQGDVDMVPGRPRHRPGRHGRGTDPGLGGTTVPQRNWGCGTWIRSSSRLRC